MYKLVNFQDSVRIPPSLFGMKLEDATLAILREKYERTVNKSIGIVISIQNAKITSKGRVVLGDGAAYYNVDAEAMVFSPKVGEVVEGEVTEVVEFGIFVRLGPIDGLVHITQIANDFLSYNQKKQALVYKKSNKMIKVKDGVKAKVATISIKNSIPESKIGLVMRTEGLGKEGAPSTPKKGGSKKARK